MLFNSLIFFVFAALFYCGWRFANRKKNTRWAYLTGASLFFYGWWDWRFIALILASGLLDFFTALAMEKSPARKKMFLGLSLFGNLGSLAAFKYSGFFAENLDWLGQAIGLHLNIQAQIPNALLILPVGISFYTFQSMSYTIDVYRGQLSPTKNILHFFAYLSMFPQLVAGPIVRAKDILNQLTEVHRVSEQDRWDGTRLILGGYFKKVVLADNLAHVVEQAFSATTLSNSSLYWWAIAFAFAVQIYCDFSGYSDIARGLARWMGYRFKLNFNHPYIATSIRDFWTRWHISLSTWFRDYVYIPLGGSKRGVFRSHVNMWLTMLISGLWHGAAWTFVIWGALHAAYLTLERLTHWPEKLSRVKTGQWLCRGFVLVQVCIAWVFFRAADAEQALSIIRRMFAGDFLQSPNLGFDISVYLLLFIAWEIGHRRLLQTFRSLPTQWSRPIEIFSYSVLLTASVFLRGPGAEFIYFQF